MSLLTSIAVTTVVLLIVFFGLVFLKAPVYRLNNKNIICLLEMVLAGEATENDWDVFLQMPIRYDDELEDIRLECANLTEKEAVYVNSQGQLCLDDSARPILEALIQKLS